MYNELDSGYGNTLRYNHFEKIGYNGVDVFGPNTTLEDNFITLTCYTKADCGGVRVFGGDDLSSTGVHDIYLTNNIIVDIPGNVDGCEASRAAFGMGLYIDHYSRNVLTTGNTVISTTISGILYQQSTGLVSGNTVYNASSGTEYSAQLDIGGSQTNVSINGNKLYGLKTNAWTLYDYSLSNISASDNNYIFHPYVNKHIAYGPSWTRRTFAEWQAFSGKDAHSKTNWFTQPVGEASRARVLFNASKSSQNIDLGSRLYLDLDQNPVMGSINLSPYSSIILIDNGPAPLTLKSIHPTLLEAGGPTSVTLTVHGTGFTTSSVVRWNGSDRPTTFSSPTSLSATIFASDISNVGDFSVTVWDPLPVPGGFETPPVMLHVVASVYPLFLPLTNR
jgi:hypothetical protein